MDPHFNQQNTNNNLPASFDFDRDALDPNFVNFFPTMSPNQIFAHQSMGYDVRHYTPEDYGMFNSNVPAYGAYYQEGQGPITPESTAHDLDQYHAQSLSAANGPSVATAAPQEEMTNDTTGPEPNEWRNLIDFEIPGPTQNRISDVFQIQALYTAYVKTFEDVHELNATRMHYAKALAFAILTHYYPKSQGFTVAPTSPGPIAKHGMNFILAADDGSDIWTDMPTKKPNTKNKSKKRRRAPTQKELEQANKVAKAAEWNHGVLGYAVKLRWDQVQPEDIAAFAVVRRSEMVDQYTGEVTYKWRPHTYLAIMIDNFDSLPRFSAANVTHRSDILSEALCRQGSIQEGYGMLLYGPRLEFYGFEAGERWVYPEGEVGDVEEEETRDIEPRIQVLKMGAQEMEMDLRARGLQAVDGAFRYVASRKVVYRAEEKGEEKEGEEASDIDAEGEDDDML